MHILIIWIRVPEVDMRTQPGKSLVSYISILFRCYLFNDSLLEYRTLLL